MIHWIVGGMKNGWVEDGFRRMWWLKFPYQIEGLRVMIVEDCMA
jgi:hypothetical protein